MVVYRESIFYKKKTPLYSVDDNWCLLSFPWKPCDPQKNSSSSLIPHPSAIKKMTGALTETQKRKGLIAYIFRLVF